MVFKRLFGRTRHKPLREFAVPEGQRVYAIGDIHGRSDLLDKLLMQIVADDHTRDKAATTLIFLGDLADRGPDSKGVIERMMKLDAIGGSIHFLSGNHEDLIIRGWNGDTKLAPVLNRAGVRETLASYGVPEETYDALSYDEIIPVLRQAIPEDHIDFLRSFADWHRIGDYLFVHAGIRPGIPVEDQDPQDLHWIRREFTDDKSDHGVMVIHGHSITDDVDEWPNRIGIDTGAFSSGKLTAIGLEGTERWFLQTGNE